ncbi:hypothetical protein HL653_14285 [Sphingomonas sp. AP4-R1]|uniref:hypothetical protein n=1 Tax=Sphingomonas sp. AP4-R1 TaxID=2735134 RepID=UPI001493589C|nr:hypothetical protein [Sphingomonas sp. AP4-R1]QJU58778.1 hypothetical protein HL653_14285 [Sphingomonas sp. AP4-R1]
MDHDAGVDRMIDAFDSGWRAGASLGFGASNGFKAEAHNLQTFWLDGFHAAQSHLGNDDPAMGADPASRAPEDTSDDGAAGQRFSHPLARALRAAYCAEGQAPHYDGLVAMLAQIE